MAIDMLAQEPDLDPARVPEASGAPIRRHRRRDRNWLHGVGDQPSPSRSPLRRFAQLVDVVRTDDIALALIAESGPGGVRVIEGLGDRHDRRAVRHSTNQLAASRREQSRMGNFGVGAKVGRGITMTPRARVPLLAPGEGALALRAPPRRPLGARAADLVRSAHRLLAAARGEREGMAAARARGTASRSCCLVSTSNTTPPKHPRASPKRANGGSPRYLTSRFPRRRPACVRDQSYDEGSRP
jgi:hypothetical protein